jgi:hypothetical protein
MNVRDLLEGTISARIAYSETECYSEADAMHARDEMRAAFRKVIGAGKEEPHAIGTVNDPVEQQVTYFAIDSTLDGLIVYSVEFYWVKNRCVKEVKVLTR